VTTGHRSDGREPIDPRVTTPGREGLTGTAGAGVFAPPVDAEPATKAPDGRPWSSQPSWRQDFPIDADLDDHTARREFVKFMVLISFAFAVGQVWIGIQNWVRRRRGRPEIRRIGALSRLPVGGVVSFRYPEGEPCLLMRPAVDTLVAYHQNCTHLSCAVVPRPERGQLDCPCHKGVFDMASGRPLAGPPRRPLTRITLEVRGDEIYATGIELRTL
jgi:Rieske Fe-S protein